MITRSQPRHEAANPERAASPGAEVLPLLRRLATAIEADGVSCCQWKGHWKQERWAFGHGDIDLLVAREHTSRFSAILAELGFKLAAQPAERQIPGVLSYYGFDGEADRLVHLHVHYRLILGQYWKTHHHLPIERLLLESTVPGPLFRIPAPELELVLFVLRAVKDPSVRGFLSPEPEVSALRRELQYLDRRADRGRVAAVLGEGLPCIDAECIDACRTALSTRSGPWMMLALRRELGRRLAVHACRPRGRELWKRLLAWGRRLLPRRRSTYRAARNRLATGGALIALVGGDGAGKTTCVNEVSRWLSTSFDIRLVHLGKPRPSVWTLAVAAVQRLARWVGAPGASTPGPSLYGSLPAPDSGACLHLLRAVCVARDRYRAYRYARRLSISGALVICDRYPTRLIRCMDGPSIRRSVGAAPTSAFGRYLLGVEESYYEQILPPDLLLLLRVHPEIAAQRKTDEHPAYVLARSREVWELECGSSGVQIVDTGRPAVEVLSEVKARIWSSL